MRIPSCSPEKPSIPLSQCKVYVGETDNPSFGGGLPMAELAKLIYENEGPSGPNREYLYKTCDAVRALSPLSEDHYLAELEKLVRALDPDAAEKSTDGL